MGEERKRVFHLGDIVRIRHNQSFHQFKENELVVIKKVFPKYEECPAHCLCANRTDHWMVKVEDFTLFRKNHDEDSWF